MTEPIAIVGANGQQGSTTARALLERGVPVRAIVREPAKAEDLAAAGAEVAVADLADEGGMASALADCSAMFLALPLLFDAEQEVALGLAASPPRRSPASRTSCTPRGSTRATATSARRSSTPSGRSSARPGAAACRPS